MAEFLEPELYEKIEKDVTKRVYQPPTTRAAALRFPPPPKATGAKDAIRLRSTSSDATEHSSTIDLTGVGAFASPDPLPFSATLPLSTGAPACADELAGDEEKGEEAGAYRLPRRASEPPTTCFDDHYRSRRASEPSFQFGEQRRRGDRRWAKLLRARNPEAMAMEAQDMGIRLSPTRYGREASTRRPSREGSDKENRAQ